MILFGWLFFGEIVVIPLPHMWMIVFLYSIHQEINHALKFTTVHCYT